MGNPMKAASLGTEAAFVVLRCGKGQELDGWCVPVEQLCRLSCEKQKN